MRTQSIDTSPEFERIQIARIRAFSAAKKFTSVRSWTQSITSANLHSADNSSDDILERDRAVAFVAREYGDHLAHLFFSAIEKQPKWRLQMPDIQEALLPILDSAEQLDVPALLIGSVAGSIYGFPRLAHDVDILADFHKEHLAFLFEHLAHTYVFDPHAITLSLQQHPSFSLLHVSRLIKIDVSLPSTVFERALLKRSQAQMLIEGRSPLLIASAEDMIVLNLIQYQAQGNNADDRWNDLLGILKVQALTVDLAYLDRQAKALGVEALLLQALLDAGIHDNEPSSSLQKGASLL
jgi:hypothetical protein